MIRTLFVLALLIFSWGCTPKVEVEAPPQLAIVNIIDQNDMNETISSPERLKQYESVDFLKCQPYKKVMRVFKRDACGDIAAFITSYHPNGQPWQYVEVINGRVYGLYQEWTATGVMRISAHVIGGEADLTPSAQKTWLFEGLCTVWNDDGQKIAELPYEKGLLEGECLYFHPTGGLWKQIPCCQGKREGMQLIYLESGALLSTTPYINDLPSGPAQKFWLDGSIAADEVFQDGKLISGTYFDPQGKTISQIINGNGKRVLFGKESVSSIQAFVNGYPEGKVENYTAQGRLASYYHQKEGLKHGEEVQVYPGTLNPKILITWNKGKIQGLVKTWYVDGQPESQREMSENKKNGLLTAWYADGSLMMIEDYDQDRLLKGEYYRRGEKMPITEVIRGNGTATLFDADGTLLRRVSYLNGSPDSL